MDSILSSYAAKFAQSGRLLALTARHMQRNSSFRRRNLSCRRCRISYARRSLTSMTQKRLLSSSLRIKLTLSSTSQQKAMLTTASRARCHSSRRTSAEQLSFLSLLDDSILGSIRSERMKSMGHQHQKTALVSLHYCCHLLLTARQKLVPT